MTDFFAGQMDYIYFFYGLAFITLSSVCYVMMQQKSQDLPWIWLGLFGLAHGLHEWLNIVVLLAGGGVSRVLLIIFAFLSHLFLAEFGRAGVVRLTGKGPGRKIYAPLILVASLGGMAGIDGFDVAMRYSLGLVGGLWATKALYLAGQKPDRESGRWLTIASAAIGLYAITTAVNAPAVPFPPASWMNREVFFRFFGFPAALLRGVLATIAASSLWALSRMPSREIGLLFRRRRFFSHVAALLVVVSAGWVLTEFAGNVAREHTLREANLYINALSIQLVRMLEGAEHEALQKAASREVIRALQSESAEDLKKAYPVIAESRNGRFIDSDLPFCYLIDPKGRILMSSNKFNALASTNESPFVKGMFRGAGGNAEAASTGVRGYYFADKDLLAQSYYVVTPVKDEAKLLLGFIVTRQPLADFRAAIAKHPFCFLIDPHGIVFLSSRSDLLFKSLWPLDESARKDLAASGQFGNGPFPALLSEEVSEGQYASIGRERLLVTRRHLGSDKWSLVLMTPIREIRVYRIFAIFATFVVYGLIIGFSGVLHFAHESAAQIALSERRHRSLVEGSPNCVILFDAEGRCVQVNSSGTALLGYSQEALIGKRLEELWSNGSGSGLRGSIGEVMEGNRRVFDAESRRPDGRRVDWNVVLNPIIDADGSIRSFVGICIDTTERKKAEMEIRRYQEHLEEMVKGRTSELSLANERLNRVNEALRDSEERFRSLFDLASDSIFLMAPSATGSPVIVDVNVAACATNGYSREEMLGRPITFLDALESHRSVSENVELIMSGKTVTFEVNHVRKDGHVFPVEVSAQLIHLSGKPYIIAIDRDIAERRRMEDALREVGRQQEAILNNIPDLAWLKDRESTFIAVNGPMTAACGYSSAHELVGKTDLDIWPEEQARGYMVDDKEVMNSGKRKRVEETMVDKEGNTHWIETIKTPIFNDSGEVIGTAGIARDITSRKKVEEELERHREHLVEMVEERTVELKTAVQLLSSEINIRKVAEETLKQSETRFRQLSREFHTLLDAMPDTLILLSPDLEVMWANKSASSGIGKTAEELTGRHCYALWYNRSTPCDDCYALKSFASGYAEHSQLLAPSGRLIEAKAYPIREEEGGVSNVIVVHSDITEKTALQAEAMRASHLASLGELAAGVAHEINNPINGIINYAQIIANKVGTGTKENDIAIRIIKEGNRIAGIVRSLLSFARERKEEKVPVAVQKIMSDTLTLTETQIRKDGIRLTIDVSPGLSEVMANSQQIQQVFLNIISNARYALNQKYPGTHEGKKFEIVGEEISIDDVPHVRVSFHDRGNGIPAEIMEKVMNPFFSTKPGGQGTGLGLSISHGIIKSHGGRLSLESAEGEYTIVRIDLPTRRNDGA